MIKNGFVFVVKKNLIIGEVDGEAGGIYRVVFYENYNAYSAGEVWKVYDVYEGTILNNLKYGEYIPVEDWLKTLNHKIIPA